MIEEQLKNKSAKEKAKLKAKEIAKIKSVLKQKRSKYSIEIVDTRETQTPLGSGAVEVLARVWQGKDSAGVVLEKGYILDDIKDETGKYNLNHKAVVRIIPSGSQIGFGDGTVGIERFIIVNPPVLVDDPNGTIVRQWTDETTGELVTRKLREDTQEAILQSLESIVDVIPRFDTSRIIKGKVGNTTTTVYPDAHPESTSVDGRASEQTATATWATIRNDVGDLAEDSVAANSVFQINTDISGNWYGLVRSIYLLDTSGIGSGQAVSSATFSIASYLVASATKIDNLGITPNLTVVSSAPASNTAIVAGDYDSLGTTEYVDTRMTYATWSASDGVYNDFTFNTAGKDAVNVTGITKLGVRNGQYDLDNVAPSTGVTDDASGLRGYYADQTGTTKDPKFVAVHDVAAIFTPKVIMF